MSEISDRNLNEQYRRFKGICLAMMSYPIGMPASSETENLIIKLFCETLGQMKGEKQKTKPQVDEYLKALVDQNNNLTKKVEP